ncbi:MAG: SGNH/GDSL hydrolase family protein [Halobacteriaceae archaeon]
MRYEDVSLHNVADVREYDGGVRLQRVPEDVRERLNDGARRRMLHPAGVEIRFVPEGPVEVTLSVTGRESEVRVFWGPFQSRDTARVGNDPRTFEVSQPEKLDRLRPEVAGRLRFSPEVCRMVLPGEHRGSPVVLHDVDGEVRPPEPAERPDRRYLAYGTSITEGEAPSAEHLTYAARTARRLDADLINLGSCGSAYCDPAMAEHVAAREDWDVASLALSVNMVGTFGVEEFRERAGNMIETIAEAHPAAPVAAITLYPYADDLLVDGDRELADTFRETLAAVVADAPENVHLIEGPNVLAEVGGLTTDLVHPGDDGMIEMGERLATRLAALL